jgi:hypothetical protein
MHFISKGAFTLVNFARDFALSLHVLLNKNYLFSLLNVQASAKSRTKSRQCKHTLIITLVLKFGLVSWCLHFPIILFFISQQTSSTNPRRFGYRILGRHDIQHYDTQHNDTHCNGLICDTQHKRTLGINYIEQKGTQYWVPLYWVSLLLKCYAEWHFAQCRYAECRGTDFSTIIYQRHNY